MNQYYSYIITNRRNGTLYTGVTNNLKLRVYQHKNDLIKGFSARYKCHHLVYYEVYKSIRDAITREKQIKRWKREWKLELIEDENPHWEDLYEGLFG